MEFFVLSITALAFFAAVIIFGYFGKKSDDKKRRLDYIQDISAMKRMPDLELSFFDRYLKKIFKRISLLLKRTTPVNQIQKNKERNLMVEKQLRLAGIFMSAEEFSSIKLTVMIATLIIAVFAFLLPFELAINVFIFLILAILSIIGPTFFLKLKVNKHQEEIREQLPDALDLLGVCIEAGLSFDIALVKVAEKLKGAFIDELMIVYREIQMGRTRREALQNMIACTDIAELKTFASALIQAEQLGLPIINVMRVQSAQLRIVRKQQAEEKGLQAPIKILIPMMLFIFPVVFIVILGPTVISTLEQFSS